MAVPASASRWKAAAARSPPPIEGRYGQAFARHFRRGGIYPNGPLNPDTGGVDLAHPVRSRRVGGPAALIVVVETLGALDDCKAMSANLQDLSTREPRVVGGYFSLLWYPALKLAEARGMKTPEPPQNVLSRADVRALAALGDFEAVKDETRRLSPGRLPGVGRLINLFLAPLTPIGRLCLRHFTVCRSLARPAHVDSVTGVL